MVRSRRGSSPSRRTACGCRSAIRWPRATTVSLADVAGERQIVLAVDEIQETADAFWRDHGLRPEIAFRTRSVEAVRSLVATGAGVAVLPDLVYRPWSLEGDRIEARPTVEALPPVRVGVVWRRGSRLSESAARFLDVVLPRARRLIIGNSDVELLAFVFAIGPRERHTPRCGRPADLRRLPMPAAGQRGEHTMMNGLKFATASAAAIALTFPAFAQVTSIGPGEGAVDIVAWPGYIERGETDKAYDWVTDFEAKTGCKVNVKTAGTSDEMVALMNEGGFDLVTASGDASLRLISGKRVQPINTALDPELVEGRPAPPGCALAHGRRRPLRRPL